MPRIDEIYGNGIPEGEFTAIIEEAESGESNAGKPKLTFGLRLIDGAAAGRSVTDYRSLQPQALFRLAKDLIALGAGKAELPDEDGARAQTMLKLAKERVGCRVRIRLKREGDFRRVQFLSILPRVGDEPGGAEGDRPADQESPAE